MVQAFDFGTVIRMASPWPLPRWRQGRGGSRGGRGGQLMAAGGVGVLIDPADRVPVVDVLGEDEPGSMCGARVIDSMPPATAILMSPARIIWSAMTIAFMPDRQTLLMGDGLHGHRDATGDGGRTCGDLPHARLKHFAHDHVFDILRRDAGALERTLDRDASEFCRLER